MIINEVHILQTDNTPEVIHDPEGIDLFDFFKRFHNLIYNIRFVKVILQ
jgi:hypothetical protein